MRVVQVVLSILSCLFVVAAVAVGSFLQNLIAVLAMMLCAVICGCAMFIVRRFANEKADEEARKNKPDFMNPPKEENGDDTQEQ